MMKKYILFITLFVFMFVSTVKADEFTFETVPNDYTAIDFYNYRNKTKNVYLYSDFETFISNSNNREIFDKLYKSVVDKYNSDYKDTYPHYGIAVTVFTETKNSNDLYYLSVNLLGGEEVFDVVGLNDSLYYRSYHNTPVVHISSIYFNDTYFTNLVNDSDFFYNLYKNEEDIFYAYDVGHNNLPYEPYSGIYSPAYYFESNVDLYFPVNLKVYDSNNKIIKDYKIGDLIPPLYEDGYDVNATPSNYTTVDLDKYDYVILNLKNYDTKEAFSSVLKTKGMIGITPVYNFGTTEKETITDRCNISYEDYTDYRLFVTKQDLTNNSVYYIKSCQEHSSFKFDNKVFDITYVTDDNINDPVVKIGDKEYHTIPFSQLSNSANQNEENNFVPGESSNLSDKLTFKNILENVTDTLSSVWDSIITFMSLVTKLFNTLPVEFRAVTITSFTIMCVLGIIKFIKS